MRRPEALAILGGMLFLSCIASGILVGSTLPQAVVPTPVIADAEGAAAESLSAADLQHTRDLYTLHCAGCHGDQGQGMVLIHPALNTLRVRQELPADEVRRIITEGAGIAYIMPAYASVLPADDIDLLARWLRTGMG